MTKTHSTSKGTLYGIRFNQKTGVSHWVTPYAWLNHGDDWYLVKYLTPTFFVKWFPFLMNMVSHEAWKVDKKEIFDNPEFQIPDNEATLKQPEDKMGASKYTIGIVGGPIVAGLLYKLTGMFLPNNDHPSILVSLFLMCGSLVFGTFTFIILAYLFREKWLIPIKSEIPNTPYSQIKYLVNRDYAVNISFKMSFLNNIIVLYIRRIGILIMLLVAWLILFFGAIFASSGKESSSMIASYGIVLSYFTCIAIICIKLLVPVIPYKWGSPSVRNVSVKEVKK